MFTKGQTAVPGYVPYGSLFRGSGSWVVSPDTLPGGGLSDQGAAAIGDYTYIFGGTTADTGFGGNITGALPCP